MILNNISNLLIESELFHDDKFLNILEVAQAYKHALPTWQGFSAKYARTAEKYHDETPSRDLQKKMTNHYNTKNKELSDELNKKVIDHDDVYYNKDLNPDGKILPKTARDLRADREQTVVGGADSTVGRIQKAGNEATKELKDKFDKANATLLRKPRSDLNSVNNSQSPTSAGALNSAGDETTTKTASGLSNLGVVGAGGLLAAAGGALLYKYFTSITHYNRKLNALNSKLKQDPKNEQLRTAVKVASQKLEAAKTKARSEHSNFVSKTQLMKSKVAELNKSGNKSEASKLQEKLNKRMKFIQKIGAKV